MKLRRVATLGEAELRNVRHGRFERSLAALTAAGAVITTLEIMALAARAADRIAAIGKQ